MVDFQPKPSIESQDMKGTIHYLMGGLCCLFSSLGYSQTPMWNNQGALVSIRDSATVYVRGDLLNDRDGEMDNQSAIYVTGDWTNDASNEAFRSRGVGVVRLIGNTPTIGGRSITRFYDLRLEQQGTARATIDVYVDGYLRLNTQEFAVDTHTVYVYHTALEAVEHRLGAQWGFVSSEAQGGLYRATDTTAAYWYPVGSSRGMARFRPVQLRPSSAAPSAFQVGFLADDPSTDGYDRNSRAVDICRVQPDFYHRVQRPLGAAAARPTFFYDPVIDGDWAAAAQWISAQRWDSVKTATLGSSATYNLTTLTTVDYIHQFSPDPIALAEQSPTASLAAAPNPICANETATLTATSSGQAFTRYDFYVDGRLVQSGPSDQYDWTGGRSGQVPLWVVGAFPECGAESDTVYLTVWDSVEAVVSNDTIILAGDVAELRASGGDFYNWTPDSALSCAICPVTSAQPSQTLRYTVEVQNMDGCADTASVLVEVRPSVNQVLFIPNVLTPNGDGYNDTWHIRNIELFPKNSVTILNRWGDVVFRTNNYRNSWDGQYSGGPLPAGTYYYVLDVGGDLGIFKGALTIIRE